MSLLHVRVRDDAARELVDRFKKHSTEVAMSRSPEDGEMAMSMMVEQWDALNQRVGELLRQMDDDDSRRT